MYSVFSVLRECKEYRRVYIGTCQADRPEVAMLSILGGRYKKTEDQYNRFTIGQDRYFIDCDAMAEALEQEGKNKEAQSQILGWVAVGVAPDVEGGMAEVVDMYSKAKQDSCLASV